MEQSRGFKQLKKIPCVLKMKEFRKYEQFFKKYSNESPPAIKIIIYDTFCIYFCVKTKNTIHLTAHITPLRISECNLPYQIYASPSSCLYYVVSSSNMARTNCIVNIDGAVPFSSTVTLLYHCQSQFGISPLIVAVYCHNYGGIL